MLFCNSIYICFLFHWLESSPYSHFLTHSLDNTIDFWDLIFLVDSFLLKCSFKAKIVTSKTWFWSNFVFFHNISFSFFFQLCSSGFLNLYSQPKVQSLTITKVFFLKKWQLYLNNKYTPVDQPAPLPYLWKYTIASKSTLKVYF